MKKIFLVFVCFCFIIRINATINFTYDEAIQNAQTYANSYEYLISPSQYRIDVGSDGLIPYVYKKVNNKGTNSGISNFKYSGFLNTYEYNITKINNKSYLSDGNYWLMQINSKNYSLEGISNSYKENTNVSGIRITKFIKEGIKVEGSGTYSDPWIFTSNN